ncbi:FAD-binding protein [Thalassorhabdomicrobium marinisediminis]|uniref:2-hydroxy-acid oxidase n=1 Tax=Thalassorhabdomicrobium marinisediminis TaxID=2170577 RepID=A0A2T7FZG5_9RHOB|nr:FAD-binding protein [Thalassorhabdomicrobium marinisediminis]PVA07563.1 2-hydroxy-acid oxidase [Thalassorhabdomicrobium marinisediminis]
MRPESETDLAEVIRAAPGPLRITGGGTRPIGAPVEGAVLETGGLSGITLYEPAALTLVVRAGTPLAEIEAALAEQNQRLAFEPMDHRKLLGTRGAPTIGGVVAGNVSGPRRIWVGACRDHMLGVRFVDGNGTILKNGGRVMKNVTGYDLVKLMTGAYGTLGVLTEVSFKVLPRPETCATLVLRGLDPTRAVAAMAAALGSPYEVTGAATQVSGAVCLRLEGFADSVAYRVDALQRVLADFGAAEVLDAAASAALWTELQDVVALASHDTVLRVSVKPSDGPGVQAVVEAARTDGAAVQTDWGGGLLWIGTSAPDRDCVGLIDDLRAHCASVGGHVTVIKASAHLRRAVPVFQPEPATLATLSSGLRARFDPRGILNPGLMGA